MRLSSALLVSLLVVASAVAPLGASADETAAETNPLIVSINGTANYLSIPDGEIRQTGRTGDGLSFERSFRQADSDAEKTAAIESVTERIEQRKRTLEARDRAAVEAYANSEASTRQFTLERARIHQEAERLQTAVQRVDRIARADDGYSLSSSLLARLVNLAGELEVLQGPVSDHVRRAASGESSAGA